MKNKVIDWDTVEYFTIPLFYRVVCPCCKQLWSYNGLMPRYCETCGAEIYSYYKDREIKYG